MKSRILKTCAAIFAAACLSIFNAAAQTNETKLAKASISSIDLTNMTLTVSTKDTNLVLHITSETRFFKSGNYAITKDLAVGDTVTGSIRTKPDGKIEAVRLFARKPETKS